MSNRSKPLTTELVQVDSYSSRFPCNLSLSYLDPSLSGLDSKKNEQGRQLHHLLPSSIILLSFSFLFRSHCSGPSSAVLRATTGENCHLIVCLNFILLNVSHLNSVDPVETILCVYGPMRRVHQRPEPTQQPTHTQSKEERKEGEGRENKEHGSRAAVSRTQGVVCPPPKKKTAKEHKFRTSPVPSPRCHLPQITSSANSPISPF